MWAISINLERILQGAGLPGRTGEAMVLLVAVLVVSTLVMVLGQSLTALGAELLGAWLVCWSILVLILAGQIMMAQVAVLSLLVAGVPLLLRAGGGLYWLVPGDPSVA